MFPLGSVKVKLVDVLGKKYTADLSPEYSNLKEFWYILYSTVFPGSMLIASLSWLLSFSSIGEI